MLAVALVAIVIGLWQRWERALALRSHHEVQERGCLERAEDHAKTALLNEREAIRLRGAASGRPEVPYEDLARACEAQAVVERLAMRKELAMAQFHGELRRKYERAARSPWLVVAPDPSPPE
jgi:hypothetical protein